MQALCATGRQKTKARRFWWLLFSFTHPSDYEAGGEYNRQKEEDGN